MYQFCEEFNRITRVLVCVRSYIKKRDCLFQISSPYSAGTLMSSRCRRIVRLKPKGRSQTLYVGRGILTRPLASTPVVEPVAAVVVREQAALDHVLLVDGVTEHGRADRAHGGRGEHA